MKRKHHVYALIKSGKCCYVGCSCNVTKRVKEHRSEKEFDTHVIIKSFQNKKEALIAENAIIRFLGYFHDQYTLNGLNIVDVFKMQMIKDIYE